MLPVFEAMEKELDALRRQERFRRLPDTGVRDGRFLEFGGESLLNLSSNDYLGIGSNRAIVEEYFDGCHRYTEDYWMASSSSRLLTGNHRLYGALELRLAALYGRQASLVFNSGYHANTGILPAISTRQDLILSDRLNHASIIDGGRIADAAFRRYRHLDYAHLESLLDSCRSSYRQIIIVTESVFSMDGDIADLKRLVELKERYGAMLVVDEAHGAGTFGTQGLGVAEAMGVIGGIDILVGTFGKAFASTGAYAVMDTLVRDYLVNTMRTLIFTTALPPVVLGWSGRVLERQRCMQQERDHLREISSLLREGFRSRGLTVYGESHIVPVVLGANDLAVRKAAELREHGILALPVRPPAVPEQSARVRFSLRADLAWEDLANIPELLIP